MDTPSTPPLEELLTHARWARALARQLLRDEQRADDVVQDAWLAAVERPPRPGPGLRAWLARLIRNLASNQRRGELRRARHERDAAAPELAPILDEFAAQQMVAEALLALDEPYRETLLRRWYGDEKPATIARALRVPVKTVDTRLARGLEKLRAELTARKGGTSREWCVMLAPLAQAGAATGVVAAWTGGAITMAGVLKLTVAAAVAAAGVATWSAVTAPRSVGAKSPQKTVVASARDAEGARVPAEVPAAAAESATRSKETEPAAATDDPLAKHRGNWHLRGRVVEEGTGTPIVGGGVRAWYGGGIDVEPPWLGETTTDADGRFELERLAETTGISLRADGHVTKYATFGAADLADDRATAPRAFELEPRNYGALVVRLRARKGQPLSRRITEGATILYGPDPQTPENEARFEGLLRRSSDSRPAEWLIPAERTGDDFRIKRVPTRAGLRLLARVGHDVIASIRLEPLAPGETREIPLAIDAGIIVALSCVDAGTREPVALTGLAEGKQPTARWTGARPRDHVLRVLPLDVLDGALALPGPGRVEIEGALAGYAPFHVAADVVDGTPIEIALSSARPLFVKVRDGRGEPWKVNVPRPEPGATTRLMLSGFFAAGRAPDCVVVAADAPLPSELDPDTPVAATLQLRFAYLRETTEFAIDGFTGFVPLQRLRVGIYDDGELVGSTDVPVAAPLLAEFPPSGPADATQTVTVVVALPRPSFGALRFRVVDPGDGAPVAAYGVALRPIVRDDDRADGLDVNLEVREAADGVFSFDAIPAGDWRIGIYRGQPFVEEWIGRVSIDAGRTTDLGTLTAGVSGTLDVQVVEEGGAPAIDAEIRVTTADAARSLEFMENVTGFARRTSVRTIARPGPVELGLPAGRVRVEVRSEGFAPASTLVDVPAAGKATCTIMLKELAVSSSPPAPEKR